jgi:hypothetical protein
MLQGNSAEVRHGPRHQQELAMRATRWLISAWVAAAPLAAWASDGIGLTLNADSLPSARWQGRTSFEVQAPLLRSDLGSAQAAGLQVRSVSVMSDRFLTGSLLGAGTLGGLYTTGGLILNTATRSGGQVALGGQPGLLVRRTAGPGTALSGSDLPADSSATVPYLGVGYTGLSTKGGWSFNADLGLVALAAGNVVKFGRVFTGSQGLNDLTREMRFAPVMQMGLSYSF